MTAKQIFRTPLMVIPKWKPKTTEEHEENLRAIEQTINGTVLRFIPKRGQSIVVTIDEGGNKLTFTVVYANGTTVKTGTVALV